MPYLLLIFEPARRHGHTAVPDKDRVDFRHVGRRDRPAEGAQVFRHLGGLTKADQCSADDRVAQAPAKGELRQGLVVFGRQPLESLDGLEVAGKMLGPEQSAEQVEIAEHATLRAPVALIEPHAGVKCAAQHAVGERPVCHDADVVSHAIGENFALHAAVEHVPAILHDVDMAQPHAILDLRQAKVRYADIARLTLPHDVVEGAHCLFERRVWVGPVHEVYVEVICLQPLQALLDRRHDPRAAAVAAVGHFLVADAELGDDDDIPAAVAERPRQGLFRHSHAVGFGSVEARDAVIDRTLNGAFELDPVDAAVRAADFPAAEPDRRDLQAGFAELPVFHAMPPAYAVALPRCTASLTTLRATSRKRRWSSSGVAAGGIPGTTRS